MLRLVLRPALPRGRGDRVPPRKSPFARSAGFRREALLPWMALPAEGRAPHAREEGIAPNPILPPFWPPASRRPMGRDDLPRFAPGPYLRTRRARPSEKNAFRAISGPSPLGSPCKARPRLGGAGSARPEGRHHANPNIAPFGHRPLADPWVAMTCPGLGPAPICGRAERVPPRTPTSALSQGFPRKALLPWMALPAEGRAPHARGEGSGFTEVCPR
jgi:hypothetical protein